MNPGTDWIDQARRVLDALRAGNGTTSSATSSAEGGDGGGGQGETSGRHPADCRWCPVCQVAAVVRGERPELTAALADVLTATATALRTFAEAAHPDAPADPPAEAAPEAAPSPAVQRIDIA